MGAIRGQPANSQFNANLPPPSQALGLVAKLARAMGKPIERAARQLLEPALKNLSDQKAQVRHAWATSGRDECKKGSGAFTGVFISNMRDHDHRLPLFRQVRLAVVDMLDAWASVCGIEALVPEVRAGHR